MENKPESNLSISQAISKYLQSISTARSQNTYKTYTNAMALFSDVLLKNKIVPEETSIVNLSETPVIWISNELKNYSPSTEQCYLTSIAGFYEFLAGEDLTTVNLPRVRLLIKQRSRRPGVRLPQFPRDDIEKIISYAQLLNIKIVNDNLMHLINMRDRAFIITLADTGLRVHEACQLRRGDVDWNEKHAAIIGKGNRQDIIRFSNRSITTIKEYLLARASSDGSSGKSLQSLPIFARHDKAAGKTVKPISTTTGRQIIADRVRECLGEEAVGSITPHSFRHYFVTTVLLASGNLKLAQVLARHKSIAVTQRYSHLADEELDKQYLDIFD